MEITSKNEEEINENILVYPLIKNIFENSESKKYLSLFSKKSNSKTFSDSINSEQFKESMQNSTILEDDHFLINKFIELSKKNLKRSGDIKSALEIFLRKSDLIEKITKFFEEKEKLINKEKAKKRSQNNNENNNNNNEEKEKEKITEIYINSIISKLADNVIIEVYKQNEFIMKKNEIGENCYFLLSGILSVLKPVEYHFELSYDEYIQYLANLVNNNEYEILTNVRRLNKYYIDLGGEEDFNFVKIYFMIKLKNDILKLAKTGGFKREFVEKRFKLFHLSFKDYNLDSSSVLNHIDEIIKGSTVKERDLNEYLDSLVSLEFEKENIILKNPDIFKNKKKKFIVFKYEDFMYLKPGNFFGESALHGIVNKRNASIRAEEDCVVLSLKNELYKALLFENNRKLKSFDVIFICKNFFFNDISTIIFNKNYFEYFKLLTKSRDDIIYQQNDKVNSVYFVKEGDLKLEINASITELYNLIKHYYDKLSSNSYIKMNQVELKEIKDNYLEDKIITDVRHQSQIMKENLNKKIKFELYTSNDCDTLGLEEYFLKENYLCSCTVVSKEAKLFEINRDSLKNIIINEKNCHSAYYNLIQSRLFTAIKRLHMIKINYINQINYKIKENFYGTEVPKDNLIKGQTGSRRAFCKYFKKKCDPKSLNYFYKNGNNEEKKNQNFLSLKKATIKLNISRNMTSTNNDMNLDNAKSLDNLSQEDFKNKTSKIFKSKKKKKKNLNLDKYNFINAFFKQNHKGNSIFSPFSKTKKKENDIKSEEDNSKKIMETTIIKIGKDFLSLKEIGDRIKSSETQKNADLSIVKNFFNTTSFNSTNKFLSKKDKELNKTNNVLSLKNHKNFFNPKETKSIETKLPRISSNMPNSKIFDTISKNNINSRSKTYNNKNKNKKIKLKPLIISLKNNNFTEYFKSFSNKKKNSFNVILTDQDNLVFN